MTNPYALHEEPAIHTMMDLFGNMRMAPIKKRQSERGELLRYFSEKTGHSIPRIASRLGHLKDIKDLYYLKASCDQYAARPYDQGGGPWAKGFFGSLKTR